MTSSFLGAHGSRRTCLYLCSPSTCRANPSTGPPGSASVHYRIGNKRVTSSRSFPSRNRTAQLEICPTVQLSNNPSAPALSHGSSLPVTYLFAMTCPQNRPTVRFQDVNHNPSPVGQSPFCTNAFVPFRELPRNQQLSPICGFAATNGQPLAMYQ